MKTLQNNFTTPEQSKRLLELGVPTDSADCMNFGNADIFQIPFQRPFSEHLELHIQDGLKKMYTPCWSVGRLIEICLKCSTREQRQVSFFCDGDYDEYSLIDYIVTVLESGVMTSHMDFSKLED